MDLGCGTGHLTAVIARGGAQAVGLDASSEMIDHGASISTDCHKSESTVIDPPLALVTDITYGATDEGWQYLASVEDLYSRKIVGWAISDRMTQDLLPGPRPSRGPASTARRGVASFRPWKPICRHSIPKTIDQYGMLASMSRQGNCYDNASIES